jgi:hypothetical protein
MTIEGIKDTEMGTTDGAAVKVPLQTADTPSPPEQTTEERGSGTPASLRAVQVTPGEATPQPVTANKAQLHRRVQTRLTDLEAARVQLAGQDGNNQRAQAIETAIQVAQGQMTGGWEHVGQVQAAQLSLWLTSTEQLILPSPAETSAAQTRAE